MILDNQHASSSRTTTLSCKEYGFLDVPLASALTSDGQFAINPELVGKDYFALTFKGDKLRLQARGFVGYFPLTDSIIVHVKPRVPVTNLTRLAEVARAPLIALNLMRDYTTTGGWNESLTDLLAVELIRGVVNIRTNGLMRAYNRTEEIGSSPRGRVNFAQALRRQIPRGINHKVPYEWHERTIDVPTNQCVKFAMWLLAQHFAHSAGRNPAIVRDLNALYSTFSGVTLDHHRRFMSDPQTRGTLPLPASRLHYRDPLDIAIMIINQHKILLEDSTGFTRTRLPSLVVDMNSLFESYIRETLALHMSANGASHVVLDGNNKGKRKLYSKPLIPPCGATAIGGAGPDATPDIVVQDSHLATALVLECKYVPVTGQSSRDAVNQAVAYGQSHGTEKVVLVHPATSADLSGLFHLGKVGSVEVFQYRYNLAAADLVVEQERLGSTVADLVAS
ncbi:hypothetical protein KGQ20_13790 [Catenulispora sp. NF23]|uniref:McrC family protein n=1 Tax=Catenulispora pinistramenti TaxID=2705254 RepID=UPI001BAA42C5|nr:hypothetical protein [Catenulispora pinistramenti]MBS2533840.1 hypothetical protein [Catenulispora pinistramenti]